MSDDQPNAAYDWDAIELDYRAGIMTLNALCAKHGVSISRLNTVSTERGWVRLPPPRGTDVSSIAASGFFATPPADDSNFSEEEIKRHQLLSCATVLSTHRRDIAKLRASSALLTERLQLVLYGDEVRLPCLGARESPADLLEKLSRVLVRCVALEREAYGLEAMQQNPGGETSDGGAEKAMEDEIAKLRAMVEDVASSKARESSKGKAA